MRWLDSFSDNRQSKTCTELSRSIQNRKLVGIVALAVPFVMCGAVALAQQPKKVPRIGYLSNADPATESIRSEAIQQALRKLGYIEGQSIATEYRYLEGKNERAPELLAELVRLKVDIIVAAGGRIPVRAAMNATKTIPIVMMGAGLDPVEAGVVESLARPGGNVTGITNLTGELGGKRLELLKEAVPKLARIAVLTDPATPVNVHEVKEVLPVAARELGLTLRSWEVRAADGFEKVFAALSKERPDGLYVPGSPLMGANRKRIVGFALKSRIPSMYSLRGYVEAGGLMSYGADLADSYRRVAYYRGQNPEGCQACRSASRAAYKVRVHHQPESREADRLDRPTQRLGQSR